MSFKHLSPQALEALNTLEQIRKQPKLVRRISSQYYQPPIFQVLGGRSASVFQTSPIQAPINNSSICKSFIQPFMQAALSKIVPGPGLPQSSRITKLTEESATNKLTNTERVNGQHLLTTKNDDPTPFFKDTISTDRNNKANLTTLSNLLGKHHIQNNQQSSSKQNTELYIDHLNALRQQELQNDIQMDTITTQFEHSGNKLRFYTPNGTSPMITPIVNSTLLISPKHQKDDSLTKTIDLISTQKENVSPSAVLKNRKQQILNQILSLDNQIKLMQDDEVRIALNPNPKKSKQKITETSQRQQSPAISNSQATQKSEQLYRQAMEQRLTLERLQEQKHEEKIQKELTECTFVPKTNVQVHVAGTFKQRLDIWLKKKSQKLSVKQSQNEDDARKECTFSPIPKSCSTQKVNCSDVYQRNQEWQMRVNVKKQKLQSQNAYAVMNSKQIQQSKSKSKSGIQNISNLTMKRTNSQKIQNNTMDLKQLLRKPQYPKYNSPKHATTEATSQSPKRYKQTLDSSKQIDSIDKKYQQLLDVAQKARIQAYFN